MLIPLKRFVGNPSQSYGASPAVWDHTVLPAGCRPTQVNTRRFNPSQIGWYSIYLLRRVGRLSWLARKMPNARPLVT